MRLFLPSCKQTAVKGRAKWAAGHSFECLLSEDDCEGDIPFFLLVFSSLLHKVDDIEISVSPSEFAKCLWTRIGAPQEMRQWVLSMISAREMRPKDRFKEGVIKTSLSSVRSDSGVLACRFCWRVRAYREVKADGVFFSLHRTSCRDCSPRTPSSVWPGQIFYITPLLLVVSPVSH